MSTAYAESIAIEKRFAALPLAIHNAGDTVLSAGSKTGRLLILAKGTVTVVREGIEIARVTEPGAVFGEISALLNQPHSADVSAVDTCAFHVAKAAALRDPDTLYHVASILARRLDGANHTVAELRNQIRDGHPHNVISRTVDKIEVLLSASGASLVYAGYPYDPYA
ncbi:MAG TPA: cyclic nucleotide-binding domain-containing protein [Pseudolabrys sp.]|nr:cyclic nucleotide-binding domain-containing protein [Pseudolabrys sp.]